MRILIVEDQSLIGSALVKGLVEEGFAVDWARTRADASHLLSEFEFDTLVLDLMLPDGSGLDVLTSLRQTDARTPVLILTAKDALSDKTEAFLAGTDDYLTKPFAFEELLARVKALTRRKYQVHSQILEAKGLRIDLSARTATAGGHPLPLTAKEYALLEIFLVRRAQILSREKIAGHLYPDGAEQGSNVIDVFINKLRRKLERAGVGPLIETVRGEGYVIR